MASYFKNSIVVYVLMGLFSLASQADQTAISVLDTALAAKTPVVPNLQEFAQDFKCSNSILQHQFETIPNIYEQNKKAFRQAKKLQISPEKTIDSEGVLLSNKSQWLYRGVTNNQFNEQQILRTIFNDPVSPSESRWLTAALYGAATDNVPEQRRQFQELPLEEQRSQFIKAFDNVQNQINTLLSTHENYKDTPYLTDFTPHLEITGSKYNGTPEAGQFLTPHLDYASGYGEFVFYVREVVKRGTDLERFNFNMGLDSYQIGTVYEQDRDEYFVPEEIPSWDIQVVAVRHTVSGWHQVSYGETDYYYVKMYEDKNPCEVYGVRIDVNHRNQTDNVDGDSNARVPVAMLLKCDSGKTCQSVWDGALGSQQDKLKKVVEAVKVDGQSIYYLPMKIYQFNNADTVKHLPLSSLVSGLAYKPEAVTQFFDIILAQVVALYHTDYESANSLLSTLSAPSITTGKSQEFANAQTQIQADFEQKLSAGLKLKVTEINPFLDFVIAHHFAENPAVSKILDPLSETSATRDALISALDSRAASSPQLTTLLQSAQQKMASAKNLTTAEKIFMLQRSKTPEAQSEMSDYILSLMSTKPGSEVKIFSYLKGPENQKTDIIVRALSAAQAHPENFKTLNAAAIWTNLSPHLHDHNVKANLKGACIDFYIARGYTRPDHLAALIATIGLPEGREVDTIRSFWTYSRPMKSKDANSFELFSWSMKAWLYDPLMKNAVSEGEKSAIQTAFVQFYSEFVINPVKPLGYSALVMISTLTSNSEVMNTLDQAVKLKVTDGTSFEFTPASLQSCMGQAFSIYLLHILQLQVERKDQGSPAAQKMLDALIPMYKNYAETSLVHDLDSEDFAKYFRERFQWNNRDNAITLLTLLKEKYPDSAARIQIAIDKVKSVFPEMITSSGKDSYGVKALLQLRHSAAGRGHGDAVSH